MGKFLVAEHCELVGFFTPATVQERRRTKWVTPIADANVLHAHKVAVKLGQ
jgi:hypothetical protein